MNKSIIQAIDHAQAGRWDDAHEIVQDMESPEAYWIHAYLHRVEGDDGNAAYWYRRAGKSFPAISLEQEFEQLVNELTKGDA